MPTIRIEGAEIHYHQQGVGFPIVLLHSLGGASGMWQRTYDDLGSSFRLIAPDARGHGRSEAKGDIAVQRYAKDAIAIAAALGLQEYGVLGLSMGGQAALHVAIDDPDRVAFVVAADTSLGAATPGSERIERTFNRIQEIGEREFAFEYTRSRLQPNAPAFEVERFAGMVMATLPDVYVTQLASILAQDLRPRISAIRCPALIMVGAQDTSSPPSVAAALCRSIKDSRLHIIDEASHLSSIDQPQAFNAAVRAFVASVAKQE